jgi:hypothetical protein
MEGEDGKAAGSKDMLAAAIMSMVHKHGKLTVLKAMRMHGLTTYQAARLVRWADAMTFSDEELDAAFETVAMLETIPE